MGNSEVRSFTARVVLDGAARSDRPTSAANLPWQITAVVVLGRSLLWSGGGNRIKGFQNSTFPLGQNIAGKKSTRHVPVWLMCAAARRLGGESHGSTLGQGSGREQPAKLRIIARSN